ncbi:hypothetical protein PR048_000477 [Dryococelus australis]|uniref:Uncharacterized protein n=1 Tax=Dryococelus australis TaxID=614101 RepID=A0ABQ9IEQ6_9NEOP|nr:hypothetical protein PR048_000477 [Dryococelus australis]
MKQRQEGGVGETGDPRENPPLATLPGIEPGSPWRDVSAPAAAQPRNRFYNRWVRSRIFSCGNRAGRRHALAGFPCDLPLLATFHFSAAPYSPRFTLIGSRDLDVKSCPNLFTHSYSCKDAVRHMVKAWLVISRPSDGCETVHIWTMLGPFVFTSYGTEMVPGACQLLLFAGLASDCKPIMGQIRRRRLVVVTDTAVVHDGAASKAASSSLSGWLQTDCFSGCGRLLSTITYYKLVLVCLPPRGETAESLFCSLGHVVLSSRLTTYWQSFASAVRLIASHEGEPGLNRRPGHSRIFASGNRAGRYHWSAGFIRVPPLHSGTATFSPRFPLIDPRNLVSCRRDLDKYYTSHISHEEVTRKVLGIADIGTADYQHVAPLVHFMPHWIHRLKTICLLRMYPTLTCPKQTQLSQLPALLFLTNIPLVLTWTFRVGLHLIPASQQFEVSYAAPRGTISDQRECSSGEIRTKAKLLSDKADGKPGTGGCYDIRTFKEEQILAEKEVFAALEVLNSTWTKPDNTFCEVINACQEMNTKMEPNQRKLDNTSVSLHVSNLDITSSCYSVSVHTLANITGGIDAMTVAVEILLASRRNRHSQTSKTTQCLHHASRLPVVTSLAADKACLFTPRVEYWEIAGSGATPSILNELCQKHFMRVAVSLLPLLGLSHTMHVAFPNFVCLRRATIGPFRFANICSLVCRVHVNRYFSGAFDELTPVSFCGCLGICPDGPQA